MKIVEIFRLLSLLYAFYLWISILSRHEPLIYSWVVGMILSIPVLFSSAINLPLCLGLHILIVGLPVLLKAIDKNDFFFIMPLSLSMGWPEILTFLGASAVSFFLLGLFAVLFQNKERWFFKRDGKRRTIPISWAFATSYIIVQIGFILSEP